MALTAKQKADNEKDRQKAIANKKGGAVKRNAAEEAEGKQRAAKKTVAADRSATTASSTFGGMLGKAANALKGRKGQGNE
jgi:hypothetical protein